MIDLKTATLFRLAYLPLMIDCETDRKIDVDHLCYLVGQYFQIKDDYINLRCEEFHKLKGKFTSSCASCSNLKVLS